MKRFSFLLVVLMCAGFSMTAYAQSEQDAADEQIRAQEYQEYMESQQNVIDDGVDGVDEQIKAMENANAGRDFAEPLAGRGTIETADEYWEQNGYPDNISFAYKSSDEEGTSVTWWEIGMINADEAAKQEILDLVSPNCRVTFLDCAYSYNQRVAIMNEIYASRGDIILDVRMSRNTESIAVIVAEGYKEEYARKFLDEYGSIILVQDEEMPLEAMVINPISKKRRKLAFTHIDDCIMRSGNSRIFQPRPSCPRFSNE